MKSFFVSILAIGLVFGAASMRGQTAAARIIGTVTDPSGNVIPGAKVTATNAATQVHYGATAGREGFYQILELPIGQYTVTVDAAGFRTTTYRSQPLEINQSLRIDVKMEVGSVSEVVEVSSQAAIVETANPTVGDSITGRTLYDAPLNGRNALDLALLKPGVTPNNPDDTSAGTYNIGGGRSDSVTFLLDGGLNNDLLGNGVVYNPNPDTIAEFKVLKSDYTAEYGRNAGGIVSVVTKSGTNQWHGSGFDFLRNDALNANGYFNKSTGQPREVLKRNQFGGTFGGPIRIPHLVQGKDRFFFFVGYQGQLQSQRRTLVNSQTFTPAELRGDFSHSNSDGSGTPDPNVVAFLQAHPFFQSNVQNQSLGIIDPNKINSVAQKIIAANLIPASPGGLISAQGAATDNRNELTVKLDFNVSDKDKLEVTLGGNRNPSLTPFGQPPNNQGWATVPGFPTNTIGHEYFVNFAYLHNFSANVLNEARFTVQRIYNLSLAPAAKGPSPASLGINITPDQVTGPPLLTFDNGLTVGFNGNGPSLLARNTFSYSDTLTWIKGAHTLKFGGGYSAFQFNELFDFFVNGDFNFVGQGGFGSGNSFADFLLGLPHDYFQSSSVPAYIRSKFMFGFAQDEWRLRKNLTVTLGTRYEYGSPRKDVSGHTYSFKSGQRSQVFTDPSVPVGLVYPGDPGVPKGMNFGDKTNFAPRIGFAWDPFGNSKTSVRGGFGIFYDILKAEDIFQDDGQPPFAGAAAFNLPALAGNPSQQVPFFTDPYGSASVSNPFPSKAPPANTNFAPFLPFGNGPAEFFIDPHLKTPYVYQYSLSVEREIAKATRLDLSYVGSSSHGLTTLIDVNPFVLGTGNRMQNLVPGNTTCAKDFINEVANGTARVDPNCVESLGGMFEFKNVANASFNSLEASIEKRLAGSPAVGATELTLGYTYAHSIDDSSGFRNRNSAIPSYQTRLFRASSDFDVRNRIVFSGSWDLPIEHYLTYAPKRLTQGWTVFPIFSWRTGFPLDIFAGQLFSDQSYSPGPSGAGDSGNVHANLVGPIQVFDPHQVQSLGGNSGHFYFNPTSFSSAQCGDAQHRGACTPSASVFPSDAQVVGDPALATYGTLPRNFFRGPGRTNLDLSLAKTTSLIGERLKLQLRADFFNVFNHAEFSNPSTRIASSGFGMVTQTADPRIIQLAARFAF
jgi:hypothetical protein